MKCLYLLLLSYATIAFSVKQEMQVEEPKPSYILALADWQILSGVAQGKIPIEDANQSVINLLNACNNTLQFIEISFIPNRLHDVERWDWQQCATLHLFVHMCTSKFLENHYVQEVKKHQKYIKEMQDKLALPSDANDFLQNKLEQLSIKKEK